MTGQPPTLGNALPGSLAAADLIASTPSPPYTAVIFTSVRRRSVPRPVGAKGGQDGQDRAQDDGQDDGYEAMSAEMAALAARQPGYLGMESARDEVGITVSYWVSADHARAWKRVAEHRLAQQLGRTRWYSEYRVRVATVEREYGGAAGRTVPG